MHRIPQKNSRVFCSFCFFFFFFFFFFLSSTATLQFKGSYKVPETNAGGDLHA